jgi:hypothetical protein
MTVRDKAIAISQRFPYQAFELTDRDLPAWETLKGGTLLVWTGASDHSIYPTPFHNWIFRAHHDSLHRRLRLGFSFPEEVRVTQQGILDLGLQCSPLLSTVYWADNVGQQQYFYKYGKFPENQLMFVTDSLSESKERQYGQGS